MHGDALETVDQGRRPVAAECNALLQKSWTTVQCAALLRFQELPIV